VKRHGRILCARPVNAAAVAEKPLHVCLPGATSPSCHGSRFMTLQGDGHDVALRRGNT
jgi:hypothetical protein